MAVFVGRGRELGEIEDTLAHVSGRGGALYLLSGEPGIGKSRLAAEVARQARTRGLKTVWGRCWEAHGAPAYWPWIEAFESLGLAFPSATSLAAGSPGEARFALSREVTKGLGQAARERGVLVILEDLHAADRSTLQLLELVAGQLRGLDVVVVGTFRDVEARTRAETSQAIASLCRLGRVLQLPRLSSADVAALVRDGIDGADAALVSAVYETTQGNPLFVDELVRDIRVHGPNDRMPLGVREVIRERLSLASPEVLETLEAVAVLGVECAAAEVARMRGDEASQLPEAVRIGLLVPRDDRVRFTHALYREALYYELGHDRRRTLHLAAARALATTNAPRSALAHHLLEAGPEAIAEAVEHTLEAAAEAVDELAYEEALALLERAFAGLGPGHDVRLRARLLVAIGEAKLRSSDATGRQACEEAAALARSLDDAALLGRAGLAYGSVFLMGGVDPVLVGMLEEALARLPEGDSALRARLMARLAAARQPSQARARDIELGLEAVEMARRVAGARERLGVLHAVSGVLYNSVDPRVRQGISRELEQLARQLGDVAHQIHARVRLAIDHLELGDFRSYAVLADQYEALVERLGPAAHPWRVPMMRSMLAIAAERFDESESWQARAHELGGDDPRFRRAITLHRVGFLRAAERHDELRAALPQLRSLWLAMPYGRMIAESRVVSCLAWIGDDAEVRACVAGLPGEVIDEEINATQLADALWSTADATLGTRLEPVVRHTGERSICYWFDCEIVEMPNARALAFATAVQGRWQECETHFGRALAEIERIGRGGLAARMRFELGDLLLRLGHEPARAHNLLRQARVHASELGLTGLVALVDRRHPDVSGRTTTPSDRSFSIALEGEMYAIAGTGGRVLRFKASRGLQYLAALVERPQTDVHVLDLVGSGAADRSDAGDAIDATAMRAYKDRLIALREAAETAAELGDVERAERAREEMERIAAELRRSTGKGGRARRSGSAVDRARSAVQRRIKDALERITAVDPELGGWLSRSVSTGNHCKFSPMR